MIAAQRMPLTSDKTNEKKWYHDKRLHLALTYVVMIFFAFIFLFPILFMVMSSLKPDAQIFEDLRSMNAFLPVGQLSLDNYTQMFERSNFWLFAKNSLLMTSISVILGLFINSMAAFALARLKWRGQNTIMAILIATLIVPFETIVIPLLLIVSQLPGIGFENGETVLKQGWLNTYYVQIIPGIASAFFIFLFYQFFLDLPMEIDEAARVDGASSFNIYWSIVLPLARPVIATVAILSFLGGWNAYLWPLLVTQSEAVRPIMPAIENFFGRTPEWGQVMAFATMVTLPVLAVFFLFQNWFIRSIASSAIKG
jgi:multiple sugar transport system permease protein